MFYFIIIYLLSLVVCLLSLKWLNKSTDWFEPRQYAGWEDDRITNQNIIVSGFIPGFNTLVAVFMFICCGHPIWKGFKKLCAKIEEVFIDNKKPNS